MSPPNIRSKLPNIPSSRPPSTLVSLRAPSSCEASPARPANIEGMAAPAAESTVSLSTSNSELSLPSVSADN